ncbi:SAM-dependent methyltransferase [Streptomyces sp. TSRI0384-2]|uniref:Methyltransferase domain-containing protein n=1 Tax=Streptomyces rutgersensis TaxID=53451 RepID=A0ABX6RV94_9ACTN|nr:methyltransferase domain-containing protein [Streptomyces sp. BRB081]PJM85690.1 SAM-dependent methyltransferase [Streptomyces sp. TSRI0384-2]QNE84667.1 methyltransferase domain-containing protein [Streptomyces rutgersensis]
MARLSAVPAQAAPERGGGAPPRSAGEGLRERVHRELVARQLDEQLAARFAVGRRLRVLDVGMGAGRQALRLARLGHQVTGVESDPALVEAAGEALAGEPDGIRERFRLVVGDGHETGVHFLPGSFDVVLCHSVLMRVASPDALLAGLGRMLAPGGLLSLLARNADASALGPGLAGDWRGALDAFDAQTGPERADRLAPLTSALAGIGAPLERWYGVRVLAARGSDGPGPADEAEFQALLAAEERAGRTDPYRSVAALLHLCGVRG